MRRRFTASNKIFSLKGLLSPLYLIALESNLYAYLLVEGFLTKRDPGPHQQHLISYEINTKEERGEKWITLGPVYMKVHGGTPDR